MILIYILKQSQHNIHLTYRYTWGVGTEKGKDDVVSFMVLSRDVKEKCSKAILKHNETYFSTVIAKNSALNPKTIKATSNGGNDPTHFHFHVFYIDMHTQYSMLSYSQL